MRIYLKNALEKSQTNVSNVNEISGRQSVEAFEKHRAEKRQTMAILMRTTMTMTILVLMMRKPANRAHHVLIGGSKVKVGLGGDDSSSKENEENLEDWRSLHLGFHLQSLSEL